MKPLRGFISSSSDSCVRSARRSRTSARPWLRRPAPPAVMLMNAFGDACGGPGRTEKWKRLSVMNRAEQTKESPAEARGGSAGNTRSNRVRLPVLAEQPFPTQCGASSRQLGRRPSPSTQVEPSPSSARPLPFRSVPPWPPRPTENERNRPFLPRNPPSRLVLAWMMSRASCPRQRAKSRWCANTASSAAIRTHEAHHLSISVEERLTK